MSSVCPSVWHAVLLLALHVFHGILVVSHVMLASFKMVLVKLIELCDFILMVIQTQVSLITHTARPAHKLLMMQ